MDGVEHDSTGLPLNFGGRTTKLDAQKERAKEAWHAAQAKAIATHLDQVMDRTAERGEARGRNIATAPTVAAPIQPTWITQEAAPVDPAAPPAPVQPAVFAGSGINPARLARITGQDPVAAAATAAPAATASHGINPARLARMTGQAAPEAPAAATVGDDRDMIDGRAVDSVDAAIRKGITKVEVKTVDLDERGENIMARMSNQGWRKGKKTWDAELLEGGVIPVLADAVREGKVKGVEIGDLRTTLQARVGSDKALNVMALRAYIEQFPQDFWITEVQISEGATQQRVIHGDFSEAARAEAEAALAKEQEYKPGVQPGVIGQWKREGQGIWKKFFNLDKIQIQTYNLLRDMMNKGDDARVKVRSLSHGSAEGVLEWLEKDECLLGFKEGETDLGSRHSQWQLQEEMAAAKYLQKCIKDQMDKRSKRQRSRDRDEGSRRDRDRDDDRHDDRDKRRKDKDKSRDRDRRR